MDDITTSVNAEQGVVVDTQTTVQDTGASVNSETATQKPVQTPEQNAEFAKIRRDAETRAKDAVIAEQYGESHGIKTYADYQKAIADQKAATEKAKFQEDNGFDPDAVKPLFEQWKQNDPDFQELRQIRQEKSVTTALSQLNAELKDAGIDLQLNDLSDAELAKVPNVDKITALVKEGQSLANAFFLANKKDIIARQSAAAQQEAIKKIAANGASSPGSLAAGGEGEAKSIYSMSKDDFQKMQEEVKRGERKKI